MAHTITKGSHKFSVARGLNKTKPLICVSFLLASGALVGGCDYSAIQACHDSMKGSQQAMLDMDSNETDDVEKTLVAVEATLALCEKADRKEEVAKIAGAKRKLTAQLTALKEREERKKRPKLTDAELAGLMREGDSSCPRGQEYEHHQNKKRVRCTGKQLVEMTQSEAEEYFEKRGYTKKLEGLRLRFEQGVRVYDFHYSSAAANAAPECLSVVAQPGASWQETVTRLTSVHPRKLKLDKPVKTRRGSMALLVEGGPEQYTVKLGKCAATPGQKRLEVESATHK